MRWLTFREQRLPFCAKLNNKAMCGGSENAAGYLGSIIVIAKPRCDAFGQSTLILLQ